jgi:hypothetical protein
MAILKWSTVRSHMKGSFSSHAVTITPTRPGTLCQLCQETLNEFHLHKKGQFEYLHHPNIASLQTSVSQGCKICSDLHQTWELWEVKYTGLAESDKVRLRAFGWSTKLQLVFNASNDLDLSSLNRIYEIHNFDRLYDSALL